MHKKEKITIIALIVPIVLIIAAMLFYIHNIVADIKFHPLMIIFPFISILVLLTILVITVFKENDNAEASHLNVIEALSHGYQNVYVVNLRTSKLIIYHLSNEISSKYEAVFSKITYDQAAEIYRKNEVYADDKHLFDQAISVAKLAEVFNKQKDYSFNYRILRDNQIHYYQAYYIKPGNNDEFVAAFKNIDDIINSEKQINQLTDKDKALDRIIYSLGKIYLTLHIIDLKENTVDEYSAVEEVASIVTSHLDARSQMNIVMKDVCVPEWLDRVLEFTDLTTLADRMGQKVYISIDFVSRYRGWCRSSFIRVENDSTGKLTKVIFATQLIEPEKRKEQELISIANSDELTQLKNRRAYENVLIDYERNKMPVNLVYISLDLNGLKRTNDSIGHAAGDELIIGAANCITKAFSSMGTAYRTGGDEFQLIIFAEKEKVKNALADFDELVKNWHGHLVEELSISYGVVYYSDNLELSIIDIAKLADKRMYVAKSTYYSTRGIDRRA